MKIWKIAKHYVKSRVPLENSPLFSVSQYVAAEILLKNLLQIPIHGLNLLLLHLVLHVHATGAIAGHFNTSLLHCTSLITNITTPSILQLGQQILQFSAFQPVHSTQTFRSSCIFRICCIALYFQKNTLHWLCTSFVTRSLSSELSHISWFFLFF